MARPTSSSEAEQLVERLAALIDADGGEEALGPAGRRRLLTALVRAYAREGGDEAVDAAGLTTDEAAIMAAALMRAKEVTSFELAALFNV